MVNLSNVIYSIYANIKIDARDGIFTYRDPNTNDILLEAVEDGKTEIFVEANDLVSVFFFFGKSY